MVTAKTKHRTTIFRTSLVMAAIITNGSVIADDNDLNGLAEGTFAPAFTALQTATSNTAVVDRSTVTGYARFMSFPQNAPLKTQAFAAYGATADAGAETRARAFLNAFKGAFMAASTPVDIKAVNVVEKDDVGMSHVRFQQSYEGVPITTGEVVVHMNQAGVTAVNSRMLAEIGGVNTKPSIQSGYVFKLGRDLVNELFGNPRFVRLSKPRLELFNTDLMQHSATNATTLAWFVEAKGPSIREFIWIDAQNGEILHHFSQLTDSKNRLTYDAYNSQSRPGTLRRNESTPAVGDQDVDNAHKYAGDTYDYFSQYHNRDSYDNRGAALKSTVKYGNNYQNAFWDGQQMTYGDGFANADDVVGHELSHAVTEYTANLIYQYQSGALNESFSDIFGEAIDQINSGGTDSASVRWHLGEDVPGFGAIRNLMNPRVHGDPEKTSDSSFRCGSEDNGGVHSNSGVPNHAFALMVDGGSYNGYSISGIGLTKAGKIQYRTLSNYLTSSSTFFDAYRSLRQSCVDLIGTSGISCNDCTQVVNATKAVELNKSVCGRSVPADNEPLNCDGGGGGDTGGGDTGGGDTGGGNTGSTPACSTEALTKNLPNGNKIQNNLRGFRDNDLSQSQTGQSVIDLYYKHTDEIRELMKKDVRLRIMGLQLLLRTTYAYAPKQRDANIVPLDKRHTKLAYAFIARAQKLGSQTLIDDFATIKALVKRLEGLSANAVMDALHEN